jgi:hypothetical protein
VDTNGLEANGFHGEDDLRLLRSLPGECVDLVYLDSTFFSRWVREGSWADQAGVHSSEDDGGVRAYMAWIAAPLDDLHRILKPTGALFLVCDEMVGLYVRFLLEELFGQRDVRTRMVWWKVDAEPAHHYIFYYRKFGQNTAGRNSHLYTVIHREGKDDSSLVAFSFVRGRLKRRISKLRSA